MKRIISLIATVLMIPMSVSALEIAVDGTPIASEVAPIAENCTTYMSVRDMGVVLGAEKVEWDGTEKSVTVAFDGIELKLVLGSKIAYMDNTETELSSEMIARDNRTYLPVRAVAELLGAEVLWDGETDTVNIIFEKAEEENDEQLWLARIVHIEAGRETYEGQLAVANVILNRVKSPKFPNTIYEVIFQPNQFPPAGEGMLDDLVPNESSMKAAQEALEGNNNVGESLYFCAASQTATSWVANNRIFYVQIGNHCFYY